MERKWINKRLSELPGKNKSGLAAALGLPPARITEMVKGERTIKYEEIVPLSQYLEISLLELLTNLTGKNLHQHRHSDGLDDLFNDLSQMNEEQLAHMKATAKLLRGK